MEVKLEEQREQIRKVEKEINKAKCRLQRRSKKLSALQQSASEKDMTLSSFSKLSFKARFMLSSKKCAQRRKNPTKLDTSHMAKVVRRNET